MKPILIEKITEDGVTYAHVITEDGRNVFKAVSLHYLYKEEPAKTHETLRDFISRVELTTEHNYWT